MKIILDKNANLSSAEIIKSSGVDSFDKSALNAVEKTVPFTELNGLNQHVYDTVFKEFNLIFKPSDLPRKNQME